MVREVYREKVVISGHVIEHTQYQKCIVKGECRNPSGRSQSASDEDKLSNRVKVLNRARKSIRGLINANWGPDSVFLTLTFSDNEQDLDFANLCLKNFFKRCKYYHPDRDWRYLAVVEFQERGAIHYHVVLPAVGYLHFSKYNELWGHGSIDIRHLKDCDNIGAYVCKYLTKETSERLEGRKAWFRSRGWREPEEVT